MRSRGALLGGLAMLGGLAIGCTTFPAIVGTDGHESVPLNSRSEVHEAFGLPVDHGVTTDGAPYEDFKIKGGCDHLVWGQREPAFMPLEQLHIDGWGDVQLVAGREIRELPAAGKNLIVVGNIGGVIHIRIFDAEGKPVVQTDETRLKDQSVAIGALRHEFQSPHQLTADEKHKIAVMAATAVGAPVGSFDIAPTTLHVNLMSKTYDVPDQANRHHVTAGQVLRVVYDKMGHVEKLYLNGEFLLSSSRMPEAPPPTTPYTTTIVPTSGTMTPR